jgi:ribose 5-phosphate isomerase B
MLKVSIGADHAGFAYKQIIIEYLQEKGFEIIDFGANSEDSVDYPDYSHAVANSVEKKETDLGILICGSGNGVAMAANKHQQIRCALCWNEEIAKLARTHNNANIIAIPARFVDIELAKKMTDVFLNTQFEGGRHENRVNKIACM